MNQNIILSGHLLYIDITQICGIGCGFCMYADKHKNGASMILSDQARANLTVLINSTSVKRISVSGEGEPLNNIKVFHEILELSKGGRAFEFITSGFLPHTQLASFYEQTNNLARKNGDTCNIRLSADSYHVERLKHIAHGFSARYWYDHRPSALQFSFRSVDTDRTFTRDFLHREFSSNDLHVKLVQEDALRDKIYLDDVTFSIEYKNHVHPKGILPGKYLDLYAYISAMEERYKKPFTLGSLNHGLSSNGMDVTIKPNGDVYFYGLEVIKLGNLHTSVLSWDMFAEHLNANAMVRTFYTKPFIEIISKIKDDPIGRDAIIRANNPYWVVKELLNEQRLLNRLVST